MESKSRLRAGGQQAKPKVRGNARKWWAMAFAAGLIGLSAGGADAQSTGAASVGHASVITQDRWHALRASGVDADIDIVLDWLERSYPDLLPQGTATASYGEYRFRHYPKSGLYAAVNIVRGGIYAMGGPFGNRPKHVLAWPTNWREVLTDHAAGCWNLDLMFTLGATVTVAWDDGGAQQTNDSTHTLATMATVDGKPLLTEGGHPFVQFDLMEGWINRDGHVQGRATAEWRARSGPSEVTLLGRKYSELTLGEGATVISNVGTHEDHLPPFVDRRFSLQPGQSLTQTRVTKGYRASMATATSPAQTSNIDRTDTLTTTVVRRETITVPAGTFDTCRVEDTDSATPGRLTTQWIIHGIGIPVQRVVSDHGAVVYRHQAQKVSVNSGRL